MILDGHNSEHVRQAAMRLAAGQLVGLPTETVYGLGARADDDDAVGRIFEAKGRPADHPLIVHVAQPRDADAFAAALPDVAQRLIKAFWPGPVTIIVPRAPNRAQAAAGGQATVALRCPAHPVAAELLRSAREAGVLGVAAPSANRFGGVSPTSAQHVADEFGPDLLILDGGECEVGIESTIIDCSRDVPALLRPGVLLRTEIECAAELVLSDPAPESPRAPGTLAAHYAPKASVRLFETADLAAATVRGCPDHTAVYARSTSAVPRDEVSRLGSLFRAMPADPRAAAHELFSVLRTFDAEGVREIWIETVPLGPEWAGVRDRLRRAASAVSTSNS